MLDEGVPKPLVRALRGLGHNVSPFPREWKGLRNGQLLEQVRAFGFERLLTCDKNFRFQQDLSRHPLGLIVLPAQRFEDLVPFLQEISEALRVSRPGEATVVSRSSPPIA